MRSVIQRVRRASVSVDDTITGKIKTGIVVLLGIQHNDSEREMSWMVDKITNLRIFEDAAGKMNRSLFDIEGEMLIISQFTLYGDCRKGRRPGYSAAAPPHIAEPLYLKCIELARGTGLVVETGVFGAAMNVELINDGPVTLLLDSDKNF